MMVLHLKPFVDTKVPYVGAAVGSTIGQLSNVFGISSSANSVLIVVVAGIVGGIVANFPKVLALLFKKRMDDNVWFTTQYQSTIAELRSIVDKHEKVVEAHINCRHDFQSALSAAYLRLDYLDAVCDEKGIDIGPRIHRYNADQRIRELDDELREIKGMKKNMATFRK